MKISHDSIVKALHDLGAKEWSLTGEEIDGIVWASDDKKTNAEIEAAVANPLPLKEVTIEEKLQSVGLNLQDLKIALGL